MISTGYKPFVEIQITDNDKILYWVKYPIIGFDLDEDHTYILTKEGVITLSLLLTKFNEDRVATIHSYGYEK